MNPRINPRSPGQFAPSSLDPAATQWLESVSRAVIRQIAFLKQLQKSNPSSVGAPNQDASELAAASGSTLVDKIHGRRNRLPCLVTIPHHWAVGLMSNPGGNRA